MKSYNEFILSTNEAYQIFESIQIEDRNYFLEIFNSIYEYHLTDFEKSLIDNYNFRLNESWFSDLKDKAEKGVLKVKSQAGELIISIAQKAKDILDFAKNLSSQIGEYIKNQFNNLLNKVKNKALKDAGFIKVILEFIDKKSASYLKSYIQSTIQLIKYLLGGKFITDLVTRLSEMFSRILKLGTNEGLDFLENNFLLENDGEKKTFLERLGDKIKSYPPFTWIPKLEDLLKKGIMWIGGLFDKFFAWLEGKNNEALDFSKKFGMKGGGESKFGTGLGFLFQILELYVHYLTIGKIEEYKKKAQIFKNKFLKDQTGSENPVKDITDQIKDMAVEEIWNLVGVNGKELVANAIKKIPYIGQILSIMDMLVIAVGSYLAIEPTLNRALIPIIKGSNNKPTNEPINEPNPPPSNT